MIRVIGGPARTSEGAVRANRGNSGFRILPAGVKGFLTRVQMANAAERTFDLQYYILRADETGKLLADAVLRAPSRNVRVLTRNPHATTRSEPTPTLCR